MMHKLRALLCRVSDVAAKLTSNLPRPPVLPSLFLLLPVAAVAPGVLLGRAPTVSTVRLARVLVIIAVGVTSPTFSSSSASMRRGATAINPAKACCATYAEGGYRQQRCSCWNGLKRVLVFKFMCR
jgi:hypothetical protein